jgi:hypothetical protein
VRGLSRETRVLLDRGRGDRLEPEHRARLKRAVLAEAVGVSVVATTTTAGWAASAAKIAGVLTLVGATTGLVAVSTGLRSASKTPASAPTTAEVRVAERRPVPTAAAASNEPIPPLPSSAIAEQAAPDTERPTPTAPRPLLGSGAPRTASANASSSVNPMSPSSGPTPLEEEALLLREANAALENGDVTRSLALLEEQARRFPKGPLAPERAAEHILALCGAGRVDEARRETTAFLAAAPEGPLSVRVRSSCAARP